MSFYQQLSHYYDDIFAVDSEEKDFILNTIQGKKQVLDVGCATGEISLFCSSVVESVTGVDSDASMIQIAKKIHPSQNIFYETVPMENIGTYFFEFFFDAALCLGNTLVHLSSNEDIYRFLKDIYTILEPGGVFAIQILNYDRIIARKIKSLPDIITERVVFKRSYHWVEKELHFITALTEKTTKNVYENDIILLPLCKPTLDDALQKSGFLTIQYYGSFDRRPYNDDSLLTVAVCRK